MYFETEYTASAIDDIAVTFRCEFCGHSAVADVISLGHGVGQAPYHFGQAAAQKSARDGAWQDVDAAAVLAVGLVGCPSCGRQARRAVHSVRVSACLRALTFVPVPLAALLTFGSTLAGAYVVALLFGAAGATIGVLGARRRYAAEVREARARVTWRAGGDR